MASKLALVNGINNFRSKGRQGEASSLMLVIVFVLLCDVACFYQTGPQESICLIPKGFTGPVFIVFDQADGIVPEVENGRHVYRIPKDGILKTTVKANYHIKENDFFYVDESGNRTKIEYLYGGGGAWKEKQYTFDNVDLSKEQIFCMTDLMGSTNKNGKVIRFRQFLIGRAKDIEEMTAKQIRLTSRATDDTSF